MREILFHAKEKDTGDWVEGFYVKLHDYKGNEHTESTPAIPKQIVANITRIGTELTPKP